MTTQHTPGPWRAETNRSPLTITRELDHLPAAQGGHRQFRDIAEVYVEDKGDGAPEDYANARLIASAPEMLAALQAIHAALDQPVQYTGLRTPATTDVLRVDARLAREVALAAIAKATGETHTATPTKVTVEVTGGVAEVTSCPAGVQVEIIDHDNEKYGG